MKRRAFSLIEILVVAAILALLAALILPAVSASRERARLTSCASRLRQFATALNLYRADHDGAGYRWTFDFRHPERNAGDAYVGLERYLADRAILDCDEPNPDPVLGSRTLLYRTVVAYLDPAQPGLATMVPPVPRPGTVVAYCPNHAHGEWDPRYGGSLIRKGTYPFAREDASMGLARSERVRAAFYDAQGWYEHSLTSVTSVILRFPGEPWPPTLER